MYEALLMPMYAYEAQCNSDEQPHRPTPGALSSTRSATAQLERAWRPAARMLRVRLDEPVRARLRARHRRDCPRDPLPRVLFAAHSSRSTRLLVSLHHYGLL